ncbi:5-carboxymethyl-2-hydroxymuconate isomerase [Pusillimonas sp. T2]|nr:5-carboxymethyl-2-hydroxymuconate isomerase [Pusillimonas sp. T2]
MAVTRFKLGTVVHRGVDRVALWDGGGTLRLMPEPSPDLVGLIELGDEGLASVRAVAADARAEQVSLSDVTVLAPIRRFRRDVLCTGWNYWDHFYESEGKREGQDVPKPDAPTFFTKAPDVVIGPYQDIAYDARVSAKWDYEAEIVVIIGKTGRSIPQDSAMSHVFGYCLANDVSQRDLQRRHGGQWFKGKSVDQTMPLGPWITLRDDIDLSTVVLECELNGETMQRAGAHEMAFSIGELIAELSMGMTLYAGDVLLTGTPSGIGNARTPPVFIKAGDTVIVRATGLGELVNKLVDVDLKSYRQ